MKIVLITQDDPFFLPEIIQKFVELFPSQCELSGVVLLKASPFGRKMSFAEKLLETLKVFGLRFTFHYGIKFISSMIQAGSVRNFLDNNSIPIISLPGGINSKDSLDLIESFSPDLLISIAGNEIFKSPLIEMAPKGCINLHSSLLPKYRGLMPSFWVLKNKERESGVSVFFVDEGIDSGPIIVQKRICIVGMTQGELIRESKKIGIEAVVEAVRLISAGAPDLIENDDNQKSYFGFPTRADVIEFKKAGGRFF